MSRSPSGASVGYRCAEVPMLPLLYSLACVAKVDGNAPDTADADTDTDSDTDADTDTDTDTDTDPGEVFDLGDPTFTISLGGSDWTSVDGYWVVLGEQTTIRAEADAGSSTVQIVIITVDADASVAGDHPIDKVEWVEQVGSSGDSFHYTTTDASGLTFTTRGFAEERYLFGELSGSATLADEDIGSTSDVGAAAMESWPPYH